MPGQMEFGGISDFPPPQVIFLRCGRGTFQECAGEAELGGNVGGALRAVGGPHPGSALARKAQFQDPV